MAGSPSNEPTNLALAREQIALARVALSSLEASMDQPFTLEPDSGVSAVAVVEMARSLRRASGDVCMYLSAEALDIGVPPAMLDWPGSPSNP